jgi:hypothetical protein
MAPDHSWGLGAAGGSVGAAGLLAESAWGANGALTGLTPKWASGSSANGRARPARKKPRTRRGQKQEGNNGNVDQPRR